MVSPSLRRRLRAVESFLEPVERLRGPIVRTYDARRRNADGTPHEPADYSDAAIVGLVTRLGYVERRRGESIEALHDRADRAHPDAGVFWARYRHQEVGEREAEQAPNRSGTSA
jgi:hypothetical protein